MSFCQLLRLKTKATIYQAGKVLSERPWQHNTLNTRRRKDKSMRAFNLFRTDRFYGFTLVGVKNCMLFEMGLNVDKSL